MSVLVTERVSIDSTIDERVLRGAALLDEQWPGWEHEVDLDALQMDDCERCVLGQLYGDYSEGAEALDIEESEQFGFFWDGTFPAHLDYAGLNAEWTRLIEQRRAA